MTEQPITLICEHRVFESRFVTVYDDDVQFLDRRAGKHLRVVENGGRPGVAVLAVCRDRVALVRTYRYPLGAWEWAIPRGFAHGEDLMETARAELREELGEAPAELTSLGPVTPHSELLATRVYLLLAHYESEVATPLGTDEIPAVRWVDMAALRDEVVSGRVCDGLTLSTLAVAALRGLIQF
jgi:ADP-ribose pyrophosphatase